MLRPGIRLAVVLLFLVLAVLSWPTSHGLSLLALVTAAIQVWCHFRYGTVWFAWRAAKREEDGKARRLLEGIRRPALLGPQSRAYYYLLRACLALKEGDAEGSRLDLEALREGCLRTDNDRCLASVCRAETLSRGGDSRGARSAPERARSLPHHGPLDAEIARMGDLLRT